MKRTQGGVSVACLMKYAFRPPSVKDIQLSSSSDFEAAWTARQSSNKLNLSYDNMLNALTLYIGAGEGGALEAALELFEIMHV